MFVPPSFRDRPYAARHFLAIAKWARAHHPFYRRRLTDPDYIPIIDRRTFLDHNDEILNGYPVTATTSGSTGIPVRLSQDPERLRLSAMMEQRFIQWLGGRLPRARIVHPRPGEDTSDLLDIKSPLDDQIAFIEHQRREVGVQAIITYPTNAEHLARAVLERGLDMGFIRRFGVFAEVLEPAQEALVREAFPNAQIWSSYSSIEFGMIAARCPFEPNYHHISADVLGLEVLNDDDEPCAEGERGRVVVTDYFNRRSPFIRYELGDYAVRASCPCGRIEFPSLGQIDGKIRGALLHRDGRRVIFTDLSVALRDLPGMRQYQVIQHAVEDFTVKVVASQKLDDAIRATFQTEFGYLPEKLRIEYVDEIPRGANGKFYASICEC